MSASQLTYRTFAIAGGAGGLGSFITKALLSQGAEVGILTRSHDTVIPSGAIAKVVDYADPASLSAALQGVEVVVSTLNRAGLAQQPALADAAKAVGVKLFVPSEFGGATAGKTPESLHGKNLQYGKTQMHQHLRKIGLPYTLYFTGWFTDYDFIPPLGFNIPNKTITIVGTGTVPISFTTRLDIADFVAYTLTHLPSTKLENAALGMEGDRRTLVSLKQTFEEVYGGEFKLVHRDVDEVANIVREKGAAAILDYLLLSAELGEHLNENPQNALFPEWKPLTVAETLRKYYS
ncbi:NAD(P)-binding protein [Auriculariales sp. MPI-PUGE-AT-0066]|nr:NAD(P)-binding protein [Auriculariales sp. MPI-PUGE-AT-0066]